MGSEVPPGARFAYETAIRSLDEQLQRIDALDSKAGLLLAADGIIIGLVVRDGVIARPTWLAVGGDAAVVASLVFAVLALLNKRYRVAPKAQTVAELVGATEEWIRWRMLGNVLRAIDTNSRRIGRKAAFLTAGQLALLASLVALGGYLISERLAGGA